MCVLCPKQTFQDAIRGIFNLPASTELDISFEARVPGSGAQSP